MEGIKAPGGAFVVGNAQDYLGYEYPADVTPFTAYGGDELIFNPASRSATRWLRREPRTRAALGFTTDPSANAEVATLDEQYARVADTGVYMLPQALTGDLDPRTHAFTAVFDAAGSPPRADMVCDNPALALQPGRLSGRRSVRGTVSLRVRRRRRGDISATRSNPRDVLAVHPPPLHARGHLQSDGQRSVGRRQRTR